MKSADIIIGKRYYVQSDKEGHGAATVIATGVEYQTISMGGYRSAFGREVTAKGGVHVRFESGRETVVNARSIKHAIDEEAAAQRKRNLEAVDEAVALAKAKGLNAEAGYNFIAATRTGDVTIDAYDLLMFLKGEA